MGGGCGIDCFLFSLFVHLFVAGRSWFPFDIFRSKLKKFLILCLLPSEFTYSIFGHLVLCLLSKKFFLVFFYGGWGSSLD